MIVKAIFFSFILMIFGCAEKSQTVRSYEDYFSPVTRYENAETIIDKSYDEPEVESYKSYDDNSNDSIYIVDNVSSSQNEEEEVKSICKAKVAPGPRKIGKPYYVGGIKYYPISSADGFEETGIASWYGPGFHGKLTANGEKYDQKAMTAAHKTLPLPTFVRVENLENGKEIIVRVNDRGPFSKGRIIDLTEEGARRIGMLQKGTAKVRISVLSEDANCYVSKGKEIDLNTGDFAVQIGAFSVKDNAYKLAETFNGKAQVNEGYSKGTLWYRVWITGFTTKKQAENAAIQYDAKFSGAFVIAK